MIITIDIRNINYSETASALIPELIKLLEQSGRGGLGVKLLKSPLASDGAVKKVLGALPQETKDKLAVMAVSKYSEKLCGTLRRDALERGICLDVADMAAESGQTNGIRFKADITADYESAARALLPALVELLKKRGGSGFALGLLENDAVSGIALPAALVSLSQETKDEIVGMALEEYKPAIIHALQGYMAKKGITLDIVDIQAPRTIDAQAKG